VQNTTDSTYDDRINELDVYDNQNRRMEFDTSLPKVRKLLDQHKSYCRDWIKHEHPEYDSKTLDEKTNFRFKEKEKDYMDDIENEIRWNLSAPSGRDDHGDSEFQATYTFIIGEGKPKEPKFYVEA
jgi:hypothetical protein